MTRFSSPIRSSLAFITLAFLFLESRNSAGQLTTLRVGTNSPASTESVLFSIAKDEIAIRRTMEKLRTTDRSIGEFDYNRRVRALPDDAKPTIKGMQLALEDMAKENPKATNLTIPQLVDLSFLP